MSDIFSGDRLNKAFSFPFKDPDWQQKLLIAFLLVIANFIVPLVPMIFLMGYCFQIARSIIVDKAEMPVLPEWRDWGGFFKDGIKLMGVSLIYMLPAVLVFLLGFIVIFGGSFLIVFLEDLGQDFDVLLGIFSMLSSFSWIFFMGIGMILSLLTGVFYAPAMAHMVAKDEFAAAFRIKEWWPYFKKNFFGFLLAYLMIWGISMVSAIIMQILQLTVVLCCLIPILMSFVSTYSTLVTYALFGYAYLEGVEKDSKIEVRGD